MFKRKKEDTDYDFSGWTLGEYTEGLDIPQPSVITNKPVLVNPPIITTTDEEEISKRISFSFIMNKYWVVLALILGVIIIVFLIVGSFYTDSSKPSLLSFKKLENIRYTSHISSLSSKLKELSVTYEALKAENPITIQSKANVSIRYIRSLRTEHRVWKSEYEATQQLGNDLLINYEKLFNTLILVKNAVDDKEKASYRKELSAYEQKCASMLKKLDEQLSLLEETSKG